MTDACAKCAGGSGNTSTDPPKTVHAAKRWCFTLNNYTEEDLCAIVPALELKGHKVILGKEVGESGTPHLQGFISLKTKCRPMSLGLPKAIHWEKAKGTDEQNLKYCSKDGDLVMSKGFPKPIKTLSLSQLRPWQLDILDILKKEPDDRTIHWFWSSAGGVGKTTFCKYLTLKHGAIPLSGRGSDVRHGVCEHLKSTGMTPELCVFPIPRSYRSEYLSYEALENIKDMYFYSSKYEGGAVCGNSPHLIVFANHEPEAEKVSEDRWAIRCID